MHVLIVEDELSIRDVLSAYLLKEGWTVDTTSDGQDAVNRFDQLKHDMILLDLMIEGMPGEEVCRKIREKSNVPIVVITSKSRESDAVNCFELGADDYIIKPFRVKEVIARIQSIMRRVHVHDRTNQLRDFYSFDRGKLLVWPDKHEVVVNGATVNLTTTELKLLTVLITNPGKIYDRSDLAYKVQGYRFIGDGRSIDTHIKNLRKKLEEDSREPQYIVTVVGSGYKFTKHPDE